MSLSRPASWTPPLLLIGYLATTGSKSSRNQWALISSVIISILTLFWLSLVTRNVPEPYLDEIFHIPQAQAYCKGRFDYWDPKLTTPPGLYLLANIFIKITNTSCDVFDLRLFNSLALCILMLFALSCRHCITSPDWPRPSNDSVHTALNIALFPPLFFFSALFYTDVLSTCIVLVTYRFFLPRTGANSLAVFLGGLLALQLRQTNIFWVSVFLGGLETVRSSKSPAGVKAENVAVSNVFRDRIQFELRKWGQGLIHDIPLSEAGVLDFILCPISLVTAASQKPMQVLLSVAPCIALLVSFGTFVFWNGGVVLGDKSNHVATIHLPQLLYLLAFSTFFSFPLLITPVLGYLQSILTLLKLPLFPRLIRQYAMTAILCTGTLCMTLLIIRHNTIIHPFTLADNRHYIFYVFRYTILRHPLIRYVLGPVYLGCGWVTYLTLCSQGRIPFSARSKFCKVSNTQSSSSLSTSGRPRPESELKDLGEPTTSFLLIFLLATSLSLITAPLVEPRYFIIPWVIWRLHIPSLHGVESLPTKSQDVRNTKTSGDRRGFAGLAIIRGFGSGTHDYRLWLETVWFLAINTVTGYVFLYRGFSWPQEPGKVQRFMW